MTTNNSAVVSVIVPVYNVEKYLHQCVDSILGQTLKDIQVILVDDGAKDSSGQIIDEYAQKDQRVVAIHKPNGGISSARNEGMKHICGKYVTFVDSDDWLDPDMYETMVNAAQAHQADIVSCAGDLTEVEVHTENILCKQLLRGDMSVCNKLFTHSLLQQADFLFDPNNVSIDIKACYDLFSGCKRWALVPQVYYNYRQDNVSYGRSGFGRADLNCVRMTENMSQRAKNVSEECYRLAYNHVLHAEFDILNKVAIFGCKTEEDRTIFNEFKSGYVKDIRRNISNIVRTSYFSDNEKLQMGMIWLSYPLYKLFKRIYKKFFSCTCESIKC